MKFLLPLFLFLFLPACAPPHYTAADLATQNARYTEGTVVKQSRGSFILRDNAGAERTFRTGQLTQYIPENYRSLEGDRVKVSYKEIWESSGLAKLAVLQLQSLAVAPQNRPLENPLTGTIVGVGRGSSSHVASLIIRPQNSPSAVQVYLLFNGKVLLGKDSFFGSDPNPSWSRLVGYTAETNVERVPILRGNGYIYQTKAVLLTRKPR